MALTPADLTQIINLISTQLAANRIKISALPEVGALTPDAVFPLVDNGSTQKVTLQRLQHSGVTVVSVGQDLRSLDSSKITDGSMFYTTGVLEPNDGGEGLWIYDATSTATDNIGTVIPPDDGNGRFLRQYEGALDVKWFGAKGDGVTDDLAAFDEAIAVAAANTEGSQILVPAGEYRTTAVIQYPETAKKIRLTFLGGAFIFADHNGDGLDITAKDESYGGHIVEYLRIVGPNYPAVTPGASTGAGLKIGRDGTTNTASGYNTVLVNPIIRNFDKGIYMQCCLLTRTFGGTIHFNKYGVFIDGGQTNANDFFGTTIEENRFAGVYSSGRTGGGLSQALANHFYGGIIQSNIPFPPPGSRDTTLAGPGKGVYLENSTDFLFSGTYFEDNNIDVAFVGLSWGNKLVHTRHEVGAIRMAGFWFSQQYAQGNKLIGCEISDGSPGDVYLFSDHADNKNNQILDCAGFNDVFTECVGIPAFRDNLNRIGGSGTIMLGSGNYDLVSWGFTGTPVADARAVTSGIKWDDPIVHARAKFFAESGTFNPRQYVVSAKDDNVRTFGFGIVDDGGVGAGWAITDLYENSGAAGAADIRLMGFVNGDVGINRIFGTLEAAPTIASASAIAPTRAITFISGTAAIDSITATRVALTGGARITLIPTGVFTWTNAGNIAIAGTAVVGKALDMIYDSVTVKWYPSYT